MGPASITSFCTGRPWQLRDCARDRWRFYARPAPAPPIGRRQWVAPAFGSGILSDRASFVAEKQRRRRRGLFKPGTAANVVCPRWDRAPPRQVCPQGLTLGPGLGWTGVSPRLGPSKVTAGNGWPQRLASASGVIGQVVSRKSNVAGVEACSRQGERRAWCVPAGIGRPKAGVSPRTHGFVLQR